MNIQWEYDFVERPFCEQLRTMGWDWIEGDVDAGHWGHVCTFHIDKRVGDMRI